MTNTSDIIERIAEEITEECQNDYVGVWAVHREISWALPARPALELKKLTLQTIRIVLESGQVTLGDFDQQRLFVPCQASVDEALKRVDRGWRQLGRAPDIGELGWFGPREPT